MSNEHKEIIHRVSFPKPEFEVVGRCVYPPPEGSPPDAKPLVLKIKRAENIQPTEHTITIKCESSE